MFLIYQGREGGSEEAGRKEVGRVARRREGVVEFEASTEIIISQHKSEIEGSNDRELGPLSWPRQLAGSVVVPLTASRVRCLAPDN